MRRAQCAVVSQLLNGKYLHTWITFARVGFLTAVCVSVFPDDISKIDAARITKLDL